MANLNFIEAKKLESKQIRTHIRNNTYVNHTAAKYAHDEQLSFQLMVA